MRQLIDFDAEAAVLADAEQHLDIADEIHVQRNLIDLLKAVLGEDADGMVPGMLLEPV